MEGKEKKRSRGRRRRWRRPAAAKTAKTAKTLERIPQRLCNSKNKNLPSGPQRGPEGSGTVDQGHKGRVRPPRLDLDEQKLRLWWERRAPLAPDGRHPPELGPRAGEEAGADELWEWSGVFFLGGGEEEKGRWASE